MIHVQGDGDIIPNIKLTFKRMQTASSHLVFVRFLGQFPTEKKVRGTKSISTNQLTEDFRLLP